MSLGPLLLVAHIALQPYFPETSWSTSDIVAKLLGRGGITYSPSDWRGNASANGLFFHLVQTSRRPVPAELSAEVSIIDA